METPPPVAPYATSSPHNSEHLSPGERLTRWREIAKLRVPVSKLAQDDWRDAAKKSPRSSKALFDDLNYRGVFTGLARPVLPLLIFAADVMLDALVWPRADYDWDLVDEYAAKMKAGAYFPPIRLFREGSRFVLVDGAHRLAAAMLTGSERLGAYVEPWDLPTAAMRAVLLNSFRLEELGLKLTPEQIQQRLGLFVSIEPWRSMSDEEIARDTGVNARKVTALRGTAAAGNAVALPSLQLVRDQLKGSTFTTEELRETATAE